MGLSRAACLQYCRALTDFRFADVFMSPEGNERLEATLRQLSGGTRLVTACFPVVDACWAPCGRGQALDMELYAFERIADQ